MHNWIIKATPHKTNISLTYRNGKTYRRHINEGTQQQQQQQQQQHKNNERTTPRRMHPGTYSSSQLSIEVSELHADANGRLEITCLSTIPASVGPGEQYADFKSNSIKGKLRSFSLPAATDDCW